MTDVMSKVLRNMDGRCWTLDVYIMGKSHETIGFTKGTSVKRDRLFSVCIFFTRCLW